MVPAGTIRPSDLDLITLTDDVAEAISVIQAANAQGDGGGGMRAPMATGPSDA
jgi:hypothetical protein